MERYIYPWNYSSFRLTSNSLRECCLRVAHLTDKELRNASIENKKNTLFHEIIELRRFQASDWKRLILTMGIKEYNKKEIQLEDKRIHSQQVLARLPRKLSKEKKLQIIQGVNAA